MSDTHKQISKFLSFVLRHDPGRIGIRLDPAGWVAADELLEGCRRAGKSLTLAEDDSEVQRRLRKSR